MSLETEIKKLTEAITANTAAIKVSFRQPTDSVGGAEQPPPKPPVDTTTGDAPAPPVLPATDASQTTPPKPPSVNTAPAPPAAPAAPAAPSVAAPMTAEELNAVLVAEFNRLGGNRAPIDAALKELGVTGVSQLPVDQYSILIEKVRAF
jgi:hypothetical protein